MNDYLVTVTNPDTGYRGIFFVPNAPTVMEAKVAAWRRSAVGRRRFNPRGYMVPMEYNVREVK
jgi:hypothetical protein